MNTAGKMTSFPLFNARDGESLYITEIRGGHCFKDKCINQGIIPGRKIKILNKYQKGPCLVSILDSKIMIGHGMLGRIYVRSE
jgi:Fe2+ transport system protein FeoA